MKRPERHSMKNTYAHLHGVTADYRDDCGPDLLGRWHAHASWLDCRAQHECDPYSKVTTGRIGSTGRIQDRSGRVFAGINFASQEYLNLSTHPAVCKAVVETVNRYGVHSAGSAALMGNTELSVELERELAVFLDMADCTIFPTGWGAGYGLVKTLVRPHDHVVIDMLAHACLQEAARDATLNVHPFRHCSTEAAARKIARIREQHPDSGILVVTETVFSMDSDVPDIAALQRLCQSFQATLLVDVAHDLGAIGESGHGHLAEQGMLGKADLVMGSFSKTFASNGGFVASNHTALKLALRYNCGPLTFTNAITPIAASIVRESLRIVRSAEGRERRLRLMRNIVHLREALSAEGFDVLGQPSAIVPVVLGDNALSRLVTKHALRLGGIVNLVEYPAVGKNACRWRLQVMADHTSTQIDQFVQIACEARRLGQMELATIGAGRSGLVEDIVRQRGESHAVLPSS
jgi:glycine C-acetyltransferase